MFIEALCKKLGYDDIYVCHKVSSAHDADWKYNASGEFVRPITSTIYGVMHGESDKPEDDKKTVLGKISSHHLLGAYALNAGVDILDEADQVNGDVCGAAVAIYSDKGLISKDRLAGYKMDALYLAAAYIVPEARKTGLFDMAVRRVFEFANPGSLTAVLVYPNTDAHCRPADMKADDPLASKPEGTARLTRRLKKMGFSPVPGHKGYLFFDMEYYNHQWARQKTLGSLSRLPRRLKSVA